MTFTYLTLDLTQISEERIMFHYVWAIIVQKVFLFQLEMLMPMHLETSCFLTKNNCE